MCTFIEIPNIPEKPVSLAVVDGRISSAAAAGLARLGVSLLRTKPHPGLYEAVCGHPDMLLHHIGGSRIVHAPGIGKELEMSLLEAGFILICGETALNPRYPGDIAYNAARVGRFCFHNLKFTDPVLRKELENADIELVHVEQGYTKCSVAVIDSNTVITSDRGIARAAERKGISVLVTDPDDKILLPGLTYGFIGGAAGLVGKGLLAVNGCAGKLNSCEAINSLITEKNGRLLSLSDSDVCDIGSILPLMTV